MCRHHPWSMEVIDAVDDLRAIILSLFYRHDPMGLVCNETPEDEYLPEAEALVWSLKVRPPSDVAGLRRMIQDIVTTYFSPMDGGPPQIDVGSPVRYDALAQDVWDAWQHARSHDT